MAKRFAPSALDLLVLKHCRAARGCMEYALMAIRLSRDACAVEGSLYPALPHGKRPAVRAEWTMKDTGRRAIYDLTAAGRNSRPRVALAVLTAAVNRVIRTV